MNAAIPAPRGHMLLARAASQVARQVRCSQVATSGLAARALHDGRSARATGLCRAVATDTGAGTETAASGDAIPPVKWRAHLDFKGMKESLPAIEDNCTKRKASADPKAVVALYEEWVGMSEQVNSVRAERNEVAKSMKGKMEKEQRDELIAKGKALKEKLETMEEDLVRLDAALQFEGRKLPNLTHPDVPEGGEENATLIKEVGEQRDFSFDVKNHVDIGEALDMFDFERAAEISGAKFYYLKNAGAMLELALVNWTMQKLVARGFTPMMTPDLIRDSVLEKCGFQPRGNETQVYSVDGSDLCLTGTQEIPLAGVYADQVIEEKDLPIKMCAFGHCFRTEAGAAGLATKGLYRVHQFSKVEMFALTTPAESDAMHKELIEIEIEMFTELGLHFKTLDMPTHDLGAPAYRKFDVEAWMPGLGRYGEISSASNCTDYQARRLNTRFRPAPPKGDEEGAAEAEGGKGKKKTKSGKQPLQFAHTLNATACAVPRMIIAILENFQQEDGSVVVPEPLRPYMGGVEVLGPPPAK